MNSAQGFVPRKLLGEMVEAMTVAVASYPSPPSFSSNPLPAAVDGGALPSSSSSSPYSNASFAKSPNINIILALFTLFFFATLLSVYIQHCYFRHSFSAAAEMMPYYRPPSPPHGLDSSILLTLPKVVFSSAAAQQKTQTECAICLEEFKDEQMLQILPLCGHHFHPDCIHMWLFSHTNCPLCRHSLLIPLKPSATSSSTSSSTPPQQPSAPLQVQNSVATVLPISTTAVETGSVANPNGGKLKPRKSHSTGHFVMKEEEEAAAYSSSSSPLHSFMMSDFHRCRSYTVIITSETSAT